MELEFITNDYILIWNIVFQPSQSKELNSLKHKLWNNYREEYTETYNEKNDIFLDYKNFIPKDDTIYNIVLEEDIYTKLKKESEKHRKNILKIWDHNKRKINDILKKTLRKNIIPYNIFLVPKELDIIDATIPNNKNRGNIVIGKAEDNELNLLLNIIMFIIKKELPITKDNDTIATAIIELLVLNEIPTILTNKSVYFSGRESLLELKKQIYPYWLMYLGVKEEDFVDYMKRDKIAFNMDDYKYNKYLSHKDIMSFIDYVRNKILGDVI